MTSIADRYGLFLDTVWNHGENAALKEQRQDPNVLQPGDVLFIPEKRIKQETASTERHHRFRKKGIPALLKVKIVIGAEPYTNRPYTLTIDNQVVAEGRTDGEGFVEAPIPAQAREGSIRVGPPDNYIVFPVSLGTLDPIDTQEGISGRLGNLGYGVEEHLEEAIRTFQADNDMEPTGTMDPATRDKLQEVFGQ
jgi:N-acetylmuramoyl-L-alanine amidase